MLALWPAVGCLLLKYASAPGLAGCKALARSKNREQAVATLLSDAAAVYVASVLLKATSHAAATLDARPV
jgi:hypothetical protein